MPQLAALELAGHFKPNHQCGNAPPLLWPASHVSLGAIDRHVCASAAVWRVHPANCWRTQLRLSSSLGERGRARSPNEDECCVGSFFQLAEPGARERSCGSRCREGFCWRFAHRSSPHLLRRPHSQTHSMDQTLEATLEFALEHGALEHSTLDVTAEPASTSPAAAAASSGLMRGAWRGKAEQLRDFIPDAAAAADGAHTSTVLECLANLVEHASSIPSTAWKDRASPATRHTSPAVNLRQPHATDPMLQFLGDNVTEALLLLLQVRAERRPRSADAPTPTHTLPPLILSLANRFQCCGSRHACCGASHDPTGTRCPLGLRGAPPSFSRAS